MRDRFISFCRAGCGANVALWLIWLGFGCSAGPLTEELGSEAADVGAVTGAAPMMATMGSSGTAGTANQSATRPDSAAAATAGRRANAAAASAPANAEQTGGAGAAAQSGAAGTSPVSGTTAAAAGSSGSVASDAGAAAAGSGGSLAAGSGGSLAAGSGGAQAADTPLRVYIASDSTASSYKDTGSDNDQAGWGQMLPEFVKPFAKVDNRAIGGRTARRFIDEGRLDEIWSDIQAGDYLLVQFGTNDGNKNASYELNGQSIPYYLDPATDFKTYVRRYIAGAKERGAVPVLVTPPPRNSAYCTGGNGTNAHAQALRELGDSEQVGVVDLNKKTVTYLQAICPEPSTPDFFLARADGTVDGTHFQERGARKLASFVAEGLNELTVRWVEP